MPGNELLRPRAGGKLKPQPKARGGLLLADCSARQLHNRVWAHWAPQKHTCSLLEKRTIRAADRCGRLFHAQAQAKHARKIAKERSVDHLSRYLIASGFSAARTNEASSIVLQDGKRQVPTADVSGVFLDLQRCVRLVAVNLAGAEILAAAQERARGDPSARSQLLSDILASEHIDANAIDEVHLWGQARYDTRDAATPRQNCIILEFGSPGPLNLLWLAARRSHVVLSLSRASATGSDDAVDDDDDDVLVKVCRAHKFDPCADPQERKANRGSKALKDKFAYGEAQLLSRITSGAVPERALPGRKGGLVPVDRYLVVKDRLCSLDMSDFLTVEEVKFESISMAPTNFVHGTQHVHYVVFESNGARTRAIAVIRKAIAKRGLDLALEVHDSKRERQYAHIYDAQKSFSVHPSCPKPDASGQTPDSSLALELSKPLLWRLR